MKTEAIIKADTENALKEADATSAEAAAMEAAIQARIAAASAIKLEKPEEKKKSAEELQAEMDAAIEAKVKVAKKAAHAAKKADRLAAAAAREEDIKRAKETYAANQAAVKRVEAETEKEHQAELIERQANAAARQGMNGETWTANMPDTYLKGYVQEDAEDMDNEEAEDEDEEQDEEEDDEEAVSDSDSEDGDSDDDSQDSGDDEELVKPHKLTQKKRGGKKSGDPVMEPAPKITSEKK